MCRKSVKIQLSLSLALAASLGSAAGCDPEEIVDETEYEQPVDIEDEADMEDDDVAPPEFDEEEAIELDDGDGDAPRGGADYFDPVGTHDVASCSKLAGWAKDGDTTSAIQVHVYKGAPFPFGQIVTHVVANKYRGDLPFTDKNHGFDIPTPAAFKTGCPEKVYIHAIDVDTNGAPVPGGNNRLLNLTGKTVRCGPFPPGGCGFEPPDKPILP